MEVMYFDLVTDSELVEAIREGRRMLGDDITMMLDFGYRWRDWHDALWVLRRIEDCNIFFAEATLQHDDLHGHARLSQMSPIRICGAEFAATRWEVREWIETGKVAVVQPDITPLRRPDGDPAYCRHVRALWRAGHSARLENRDSGGGRPALPGGLPKRALFRVHFAARLSVAVAREARSS